MAELFNRTESEIVKRLHRRASVLGIPISGTFELTGKCNFRCKMCYVHDPAAAAAAEPDAERWLMLARQVKDAGTLFLTLTGGEPLMHPAFDALYRALNGMGFVININTNGSLIDEKRLRLFSELPPSRINVSLYGADEDTYRSLCCASGFERAFFALRQLKKTGVDVKANVAVNAYNAHAIERIYALTQPEGIPVNFTAYTYTSPRTAQGRKNRDYLLSPAEAARAMLRANACVGDPEKLRVQGHVLRSLRLNDAECLADDTPAEGRPMACKGGRTSFWITYDQKMTPCGMLPFPAVDVRDTPFADAWKQLREQTDAIRLPAKCAVCPHRADCGACAASCYSETGRFDAVPPFMCDMMHSLHDQFIERYGGSADED